MCTGLYKILLEQHCAACSVAFVVFGSDTISYPQLGNVDGVHRQQRWNDGQKCIFEVGVSQYIGTDDNNDIKKC